MKYLRTWVYGSLEQGCSNTAVCDVTGNGQDEN